MGYRLLAPASASDALADALKDAGASSLSPESYESLRVEAGLPGPDELTEDYTPLEANLSRAVSSTKGCYTGQEIIARQVTYDKVTKRMVGLRLDAPVTAGAQVTVEGKSAGTVTSVTHSPRYGSIALAVLKRPHDEPDTTLVVSNPDGDVSARVAMLPFGSGNQ
jgi:folate-binding protein YgfZ